MHAGHLGLGSAGLNVDIDANGQRSRQIIPPLMEMTWPVM